MESGHPGFIVSKKYVMVLLWVVLELGVWNKFVVVAATAATFCFKSARYYCLLQVRMCPTCLSLSKPLWNVFYDHFFLT